MAEPHRKYRIAPCGCVDCQEGHAALVKIMENDKLLFGVCIDHGEMQFYLNGEWTCIGPIIRTEEDLFNAFAAMTQKRLKADTDG